MTERRNKKRKPPKTPRRRAFYFGAGALLIFGGIGAWLFFRKDYPTAGGSVAGVGSTVFLLSVISPKLGLAIRTGWLKFAAVLGWINTRILLGVIFYLILTPLALARRLFSGSPLDLEFRAEGMKTYWQRREDDYNPKHYERPW